MRILIFALLLFFTLTSASQEKNDVGLLFGTSYYMGDYNPGTQFYKPSVAIGVLFRRNFNELYAIRVSGLMGGLRGEYNPTKFFLPGDTPSFNTRMINLETMLEIGFMPFSTRLPKRQNFSPYTLVGIGGSYINGSFILHIPFGVGAKYSPSKHWTVGIEWRLHKTFSDRIDNYVNVSESPKSFIHNNDWFGIAGIVVTYRLVNKGAICPAYK